MKIAKSKSQNEARSFEATEVSCRSPLRKFCILHFAICILTFGGILLVYGCERDTSAAKAAKKGAEPSALPVTVTPVRTQKVQRTV